MREDEFHEPMDMSSENFSIESAYNFEEVHSIANMTHIFYCRRGSHYGVAYGLLMECPYGCHRDETHLMWN